MPKSQKVHTWVCVRAGWFCDLRGHCELALCTYLKDLFQCDGVAIMTH